MRIGNYHTHMYLCKHAVGTIDEYIDRAINLGYEYIGMSDHGPISDELTVLLNSRRMSMDEYKNVYLKDLKRCKKKYQGKIVFYKSTEVEYYPEYLSRYQEFYHDLDYLVLGQHFVKYCNSKNETIENYKSVYDKEFNYDDVERYKELVIEAMETKLFRILAHPDIFMLHIPSYDDRIKKITNDILLSALKNGVAVEVNCNGIRNLLRKGKDVKDESLYKYPHPAFWDQVRLFKIDHPELEIIVSDDAHNPEYLNDYATELTYQFVEKHQLDIVEKLDLKRSK